MIGKSLLAILDEGPSYGLRLRDEFEARTGGIWPLNVGQVYTTLSRLVRDDLVAQQDEPGPDGQKMYEITAEGRKRLKAWFSTPIDARVPERDELVLKLVMAATDGDVDVAAVAQAERRNAVELLQEYTRRKREVTEDTELGRLFLVESLIYATEARVRWLDACEARLKAERKRKVRG